MNSLVRMIAGTFVRSLVYKGTRRLGMPASIALAIVGAVIYVALGR